MRKEIKRTTAFWMALLMLLVSPAQTITAFGDSEFLPDTLYSELVETGSEYEEEMEEEEPEESPEEESGIGEEAETVPALQTAGDAGVLSMLATAGVATDSVITNDLYWTVDGFTLYITDSKDGFPEGVQVLEPGKISSRTRYTEEKPAPWQEYADMIESVSVGSDEHPVRPYYTAEWFAGLENLEYLDLYGLDTTNVVDFSGMFRGCSLIQSIDISNFNIDPQKSPEISMSKMFKDCSMLESVKLGEIRTELVTDMSYMFSGCSHLYDLDLSGFDTSALTTAKAMFQNCSDLPMINTGNFDVSNVTDFESMFEGCASAAEIQVGGFVTESAKNMSNMFSGCESVQSLDLGKFSTSKVNYMDGMFRNCASVTALDVSGFNTLSVMTMKEMFRGCSSMKQIGIDKFEITSVTDLSGMFRECSSVKNVKLQHDMSAVTNVSNMFRDCTGLETVTIDTLYTTAIKDYSSMFEGCDHLTKLTLLISSSNAENYTDMLAGCVRLQEFTKGASCRIDSKAEDPDTNVSGLPNPDSEYTFGADGHWYCFDDSSVVARYTSDKLPNGIRGTYSATYVVVTYDPNGYAVDQVKEAVPFGEAYLLRANPFPVSADKKEYFWNTRIDGTGTSYKELDLIPAESVRSLRKTVLYAQWENASPETHTVTWVNYDSEVLATQSDVQAGTYVTYSGKTPLKPMDGTTAYYFSGWDPDPQVTPITADTTFTAQFTARPGALFEVSWLNDDGSLIVKTEEGYGNVPTYPSDQPQPEKQNPKPGKVYTFTGWTPELNPAICDTSYTAAFSEEWEDVLYWGIKSHVLTIAKTEQTGAEYSGKFSASQTFTDTSPAPWHKYAELITSVTVGTVSEPVEAKVLDCWFADLEYAEAINLDGLDSMKVTSANHMFENCRLLRTLDVGTLSTGSMTSAEFMFSGCSGLTELNVTHFDTSEMVSIRGMFYGMTRLKNIDISGFSFAKITDASGLFAYCTYVYEIRMPGASGMAGALKDVSSMFSGCRSLEEIDISGLDFSQIIDAEFMFNGCATLKKLDISGLRLTSGVTKSGMLRGLNHVELLTVGAQGSVRGTGLATPSKAYVSGADGYWYSATDYQKYISEELPENKADTYRALFAWIDYDSNGYAYAIRRKTVKSTDKTVGIMNGSYMEVPGKVLAGWCLDPAGNGKVYLPGRAISLEEAKPLFGKTLYAIWKNPVISTASITWKNWDGEILDRETYTIGEMPSYKGDTPTRPDDSQYTYTFEKWDPAFTKVTEDATYTAKYTPTSRNFTVRWINYNEIVLATQSNVPAGTYVTYSGPTPVRADTPDGRYIFTGWDPIPDVTPINGDTDFKAKFRFEKKEPVKTYTVEWRNWDNTLLETSTDLVAGEKPTYTGKAPTRDASEYYIYSWTGWSPTVTLVSKDQTYKAVFEAVKRTYIVKYDVNNHGITPASARVPFGDPIPNPGTLTAEGFVFQGWFTDKEATVAWDFAKGTMPARDITLYAGWKEDTTGGGGGGGGGTGGGTGGGGGTSTVKSIKLNTGATFSEHWFADATGKWHLYGPDGKLVTSMWVCDDAVAVNRCDVWYLLRADGTMEDAGLVQDNTGNYYSLEMQHNGYYGMLRYTDGYYDGIYLEFNHEHNGSFGAIKNASGIEKLKAKYGVTKFGIGNEHILYTSSY